MQLVRYNPLRGMLHRWPTWDDEDFGFTNTANNLDVSETENEVVIKANVAGVPADAVDLTFEEGVLWIKAEKTQEEEDENKQHYLKSSWNYSYKVAVPGMIDHSVDPTLVLEDGILTVTFKKSEASKPKRFKITGKTGK
jgi:HSP20 family protein